MLFDLHNDFPTCIPIADFGAYLDKNKPTTVTAAIWTSELKDSYAEIKTLTKALREQALRPPIAIEDMGFLGKTDLDTFDFSAYIYCSLTWNYNNKFAGGALDTGDLTALGKKLISLMNGRCAVDLAHLNKRSFYSALEFAHRPICSHTGFNGHLRSLDDGQIRALIAARGIIGVSVVKAFTDAKDVKMLAAVIDGFAQRYGVERLCMGTDFNGTSDLPDGFTDYGDVPALRVELEKVGFTDHDIDNIFYLNAQRFYEEIQSERHL